MMGFGFVFMILFWAAIVVAALWLLDSLFPLVRGSMGSNRSTPTEDPKEIARRRYANGEISQREFQQMLESLTTG